MNPHNAKYPRLAIRVSEETRAALEQLAKSRGMKVSQLVKSFINIGLALQKLEK